MQGTKEIKRRIKSVKSTKKITKAMELVAASKMKRAVSATLSSRLYAEYSWDILTSIGANLEEITHPLFVERGTRNILLILITSNRGLCGAYNAQVIKKVLALLRHENAEAKIKLVTIGKKGDRAMRRIGRDIVATFSELPDSISLRDVSPISTLAINEYNLEHFDKVIVAYTDFVSAMNQKPNIKQILPISKADLKDLIDELGGQRIETEKTPNSVKIDYLIEGEKEKLIGTLAEKLCRMQIYQMLLESNASEQSSRMVAMKNASEAAGEMIEDLTLAFNKARQSGITQEISEISAGMASVN